MSDFWVDFNELYDIGFIGAIGFIYFEPDFFVGLIEYIVSIYDDF